MTEQEFRINTEVYNNNLNLYTIIKLLLQCKLQDQQYIVLQRSINNARSVVDLENIFSNANTTTKNPDKINAFNYLAGFARTADIKKFCAFVDVAIDLLLIKDLIIAETKVFVNNEYKKEISQINDYLSIETDIANIQLPYGQRVASALLLFALTTADREHYFLLSSSGNTATELTNNIDNLTKKYMLNFTSTMQIIVDECINQSIKATAGSSYEDRVVQALTPIVQNISGHSHDKKSPAVEYDNTFVFNNKLCGVSSKRTLRERYKQNHDDVANLSVDYMFIITLGIDLNEDKVRNILSKNGNYIIVASEQYEQKSYLKNNPKVISSANIKASFERIII